MTWHKFHDFLLKYRLAELPAVVCLFGADLYLRKLLVDALEKKFGNGQKVERENFYAAETDPENVLVAGQTFSMFAQKKLIIVHQFQAWTAKQRATALTYLDKPNPQTILILVADDPPEEYPRRKEYKKWFDSAATSIELVDLTALTNEEVKQLITELAQNMGKRISSEAAELLLELVGPRPELLFRELEKISLALAENKSITPETVHELVLGSRLQNIFEFTNALGRKDLAGSLRIYAKMRELISGNEIFWFLGILNMVKRHYRILLETQAGLGSEQRLRAAMERNKIFGPNRKDYIAQAEKFSPAELLNFFELCHETELKLWSSKIDTEIISTVTDSNLLIENLIFKLCRTAS